MMDADALLPPEPGEPEWGASQQLPQNLRRKDAEPGPLRCLHVCFLWRLISLKLCRFCFTSAPGEGIS
jgi:hypothetical protein